MSFEPEAGPNYGILTQRFMSSGQWDRSLAASLEWLAKDPENLRAHRAAAQSLVNLERHDEAESHLTKVLAGNPADGFAHRLMSMVYFNRGAFKAADESIRRAISLNPNDAYHWHQLAHMSYRQGDLATAKKCVARARELNPRDANILNLAILCEPDDPNTTAQKIRQYQEALALDPANANLHNNLGAQYLDRLKDYGHAEECFRRALFFDPSSKIFRRNLFITVKHRDLIYRVLCTPKDWLIEAWNFFGHMRKRNILFYILLIPVWLVAFRFILGGLVLWFALVWPLTKVYEYLTIGDIRAQTGELGVRRGGFLGYRKWPLKIRLSIFALVLVSFWGAVAFVCLGKRSQADNEFISAAVGTLILLAVLFFLGYFLMRKIKGGIKAWSARKRARQMAGVFNPERKR
ncbi:MAG TPA: tetratricopeptide repeat protein [Candidatus Sulfotelmatobacter sp.]|jgi:tetratricopeptide (TPR) repeat protein|nr:tetratricopeptide repeat protein [Candidatus Sulfotelmatobacter sp.]